MTQKQKKQKLIWWGGFFHVSMFWLLSHLCPSPLLSDILKAKSGRSDEIIGTYLYIYIYISIVPTDKHKTRGQNFSLLVFCRSFVALGFNNWVHRFMGLVASLFFLENAESPFWHWRGPCMAIHSVLCMSVGVGAGIKPSMRLLGLDTVRPITPQCLRCTEHALSVCMCSLLYWSKSQAHPHAREQVENSASSRRQMFPDGSPILAHFCRRQNESLGHQARAWEAGCRHTSSHVCLCLSSRPEFSYKYAEHEGFLWNFREDQDGRTLKHTLSMSHAVVCNLSTLWKKI